MKGRRGRERAQQGGGGAGAQRGIATTRDAGISATRDAWPLHNQLHAPFPLPCSPCLCTRELQGGRYLSKCIFVNGCPACKDPSLTPYCCHVGGCYCTNQAGEAYYHFTTDTSFYNKENCNTEIFPNCKP